MLCPSPSRVWARGGRGRSASGFLQRGGAAASAGGGSGSCPPAGRGAGEDGGGIAGLTLLAPLLVASPPSPLPIFSGWEIACWMGGATYRVCSVGRGAPLAQGFFFVCSAQVSLWPRCQRSAAGWTSSGLGSQQRGASRALALAGSCVFLADRPACSFQKSLRCYRKAKTALLQVPLSHLERQRAESRLFLPSLEVLPGFLCFPRAGC